MSDNVINFRPKRRPTVRGAARRAFTEAMDSIKKPSAAVIVILGEDGRFSFRSVVATGLAEFDAYSRAGAIIDKERMALLD